jgi:hypothetical protein
MVTRAATHAAAAASHDTSGEIHGTSGGMHDTSAREGRKSVEGAVAKPVATLLSPSSVASCGHPGWVSLSSDTSTSDLNDMVSLVATSSAPGERGGVPKRDADGLRAPEFYNVFLSRATPVLISGYMR